MKPESEGPFQHSWRAAKADRLAVLIDGAETYGSMRKALLRAERSILILGWDVDSRTPLVGEDPDPDDGAPPLLGDFLAHLVDRREALEIRILLWDYSMLYSLEREPLPRIQLGWRTPPRLKVQLDDELPIGASHHQKIVVIDDSIAFVGGLDLTINRWDTRQHLPGDSRRKNPDGEIYEPFHDVQMLIDGDAAGAVSELARTRWERACGERLEPTADGSDPWPEGLEPELRDIPVAIARTVAEYADHEQVCEVRSSLLAMIAAAERSIYIENQYLTAKVVAEALRERVRDNESLEVVAICPESPGGWLEAKTMGTGLQHFMGCFREDAIQERVRFLAPSVSRDGRMEPLMVHSKLAIVDDRWLRIGSANLSNRSMSVDTECDLIARAETDDHEQGIRAIRDRLLSEHLGIDEEELRQRTADGRSLLAAIDDGTGSGRKLKRLQPEEPDKDGLTEACRPLADPEQPVDPGEFLGNAFGALKRSSVRLRLTRLSIAGVAIIGLILLWHLTPLSQLTDPEVLSERIGAWRDGPWTMPALLLAFLAGSLLAFPITVLFVLTAMLLGPWQGFLCALAGSLAGAAAGYGLGALLGRKMVDDLLGRFRHSVDRSLQNNGVAAAALLRVVPVAPFTVINVLLGSSSVRFGDYMLGTVMGMTPGIAVITFLGDRLGQAWQNPDVTNVSLLILAILVWIGLAVGLQMAARRVRGDD